MTDLSYTTTARVLAKMDRSAAEIRAALIAAGAHPDSADRSISKCRQEGLLPPHQFRHTFRAHGVTFVNADTKPHEDLSPIIQRQQNWLKNAKASQWHLIDVKRAGHRAADTEYNIPPDGPIAKSLANARYFETRRSYCGSSAAMCVES